MEHYAHIDAMDARQEEEEEEERERIRDDYEERLRQERSRVALQQYLAEEDVRMRGSDGPLDWIIRGGTSLSLVYTHRTDINSCSPHGPSLYADIPPRSSLWILQRRYVPSPVAPPSLY